MLLIGNQKLKAQLDMAFITDFSAASMNSFNRLNWTIEKNDGVNSFQLERSTNGKDFKVIAIVMATEKFSTESYSYVDTVSSPDKIMYRLKVVSKTQHSYYSKILLVKSKMSSNYNIKIIGNPINDKLSFNYNSVTAQQVDIKIYSLAGNIIMTRKINCFIGNNLITIPLIPSFSPGLYVIEMNNGILSQIQKFIKQ